jgi:hypothetical protein
MAGLLAVFAEFEHEILRERVRAGLDRARQNGKKLGRPITAGLHADQIRTLYRAGITKSEIARRLRIGRTRCAGFWDDLFLPQVGHRFHGGLRIGAKMVMDAATSSAALDCYRE